MSILKYEVIKYQGETIFELVVSDAPQNFQYPLEDEACFIHVKQGHNIAYTPNEIVEVPENNLAFSNSGNIIFKTAPSSESGFFEALIVHVKRDMILDFFASRFPNVNDDSERSVSVDVVTGQPCIVLSNYIKGLSLLFDNEHLITDDYVLLKVKEIVLLLLQSKKADEVVSLMENFVNKLTATFKTTIDTYIDEDVSLNDLAHLCNMSLSTFKRNFRKVYNTTPSEYLFERKLERSRRLLAASEDSVMGIAHLCGFKTVSHFSRKFKEKYGISPSEFKLTLSDK